MFSSRIILLLAWRNVWRNRRRTVLTLLTIMIGAAMIVFLNAMARGGHDQMIEDAAALNAGHIQIHEKGFQDNQTIDYAFIPSDDLIRFLDEHPDIQGRAPRVLAGGLLAFEDNTRGVMIQGIDPEEEINVSDLYRKILPGGRYLSAEDSLSVIMGKTLADNAGVAVGDSIALISQGFDGSIAADRFVVEGLFVTGNPEYDRNLVLMPLSQAQETFTMMGHIHTMALRLSEAGRTDAVKAGILDQVANAPYPLEVLGWDELMPELVQFIVMDDIGGWIFDGMLFLVVAFGILNTIQMSVFERTREFGIMLSIGTRPAAISGMILIESMVIAVMGIVLGAALGGGVSLYFEFNPLDYSRFSKEIAVWGMTTTVYPAIATKLNILATSATIFVLAVLFSLLPARRAARLNPVDAIRKL